MVPEDLGITVETIFCAPERTEKTCLPIDGFRPNAQPPIVLERNHFYFYQLFRFRVTGGDGLIVHRPAASFKRAIQADANESIELYFLEAYPAVTLHLRSAPTRRRCRTTSACSRRCRTDYKDQPLFMYRLITTKPLAPGPGVVAVEYDDIHRPVDKIVISTGTCRKKEPGRCDPHRIFPKLLFKFLQTLIRKQHLFGPDVELSAKFFDTYKGIFFETDLYTNPNRPNTRYTVVSADPAQLRAEITDDDGFRCRIELTVDPTVGGIDWTTVTDLTGLSPVPESADTQLFTADIIVMVQGTLQSVRVRGRSCYPMLVCQDQTPTGGVGHVGAFLTELVAANRLARPAGTLRGGDTRAFGAMVGLPEPPAAVRIVTSVEPGAGAELRAVLNPGDRMETQVVIRGADATERRPVRSHSHVPGHPRDQRRARPPRPVGGCAASARRRTHARGHARRDRRQRPLGA